MSRIAYPFLTLGADAIESTVWELVTDTGQSIPLQKYIEDWDYLRPLRLRRTLRINRAIAAMHLGIPEDVLQLSAVVRVGTGPGSKPRAWVHLKQIEPDSTGESFEIDEQIPGSELSGRLRLETCLLSYGSSRNASRLAPAIDGARVWEHEYEVRLEGTEPRFPMETVSFGRMFSGRPFASSLWHLHWSPGSIHRDFGGAVRLYINSDREDFVDRLTASDPILLQTIMADVMTQLISRVVVMDDAQDAIEQAEDGTIASYIGSWIGLAFPGESISEISSKLERRPGEFYSGIQAAAEVGGIST